MDMTGKDWTLLVVAAAHGKAVSPVQLQKALFLLGENLSSEQRHTSDFYDFTPYDYGPFDSAVYADAEALQRAGLVENVASSYRMYLATPDGQAAAGELRGQLSAEVVGYLDGVVRWVRKLSFNQLVRAIYAAYPNMKVNSVFRD